jgi:16S rRNA (cytosine967-C5)-methyltransferase
MQQTARLLAYNVLFDIEANGAYANLALDHALAKSKLALDDKRLATEIVYGTTRMKYHLDTELQAFCNLKKTDLPTLILLRMSVYQIEYLKNIPDYAVIHEAVEIAKSVHPRSQTFVNAVLRSFTRGDKKISWPDKRRQRNQYIARWYSFPQWMVDQWVKAYGFESTEKLCAYFNQSAPSWIRVNTLVTNPDAFADQLQRFGVPYFQNQYLLEAFKVDSLQMLLKSSAFSNGDFIVQDLSSMLPACVLAPKQGSTVLDMCAAPGGKTTQLSAIMHNSGQIVACELYDKRAGLIKENAMRLHAENITTVCADALTLPEKYIRRFDYILLDAPCSGLGVLNRRADLRWRKRRSDIDNIIALQSKLLDAAAIYAAKNSRLVYSTCTLNKSENEDQINKFLARHPDFKLEAFSLLGKPCDGMRTIYPFSDHSDGFFVAKMIKGE